MCVKKAANCGAVERRGSAQENCPAAKSPLTEFPSGHGHSVCAVSIRQVGLIDESAAAFRAARPGRPIGDLCKATVREKWKMVEGDGFEPSYAKRPDLQSDWRQLPLSHAVSKPKNFAEIASLLSLSVHTGR